jgi:hypothetical protein
MQLASNCLLVGIKKERKKESRKDKIQEKDQSQVMRVKLLL